ncbi:MAG: hypothetical protein ACE5PO_07795, partial [Candidatus Bathyarchaeia archaeon]
RDLANRILDAKMDNVAAAKADIVATSNPPCLIQLHHGVRSRELPIRVMHIAEVLDAAYNSRSIVGKAFPEP